MKKFDPEELKQYDGRDGRPIYVAYEGRVYDLSGSKMWRKGLHMQRHQAGQDLTTEIQGAPHSPEVLARFPQVGVLEKKSAPERAIPAWLGALLHRVPMLRRHPHPMTVHFPIAFMLAAPCFSLLYLLTNNHTFETTAFHCLGAGVFFTLVAMGTGYYTWWLNYMAKPLRPVRVKRWLAAVMLVLAVTAFVWRLADPTILRLQGAGIFYCLMIFSFVPFIIVIGWMGAAMTFPVHKE